MANKYKVFDPQAERNYYHNDSITPPSNDDLDRLWADMHLWIPGLPSLFKGQRILDLGAGKASIGTVIAQYCTPAKVVSLELVLQRLRAAIVLRQHFSTMSLVCGDVFNLPFKDNFFNFIIANSFLHHLPNVKQAIIEIVRVLKPGGFYIGREPNFNNPLVRLGVFTFPGTPLFPGSHSPNEYPLRAKEIMNAFNEAGCRCKMHYFWRRLPKLHHSIFSAAISVRAQRPS
jgi:ubiquinone/menaquinone biosynthesis C-methylase UbiE